MRTVRGPSPVCSVTSAASASSAPSRLRSVATAGLCQARQPSWFPGSTTTRCPAPSENARSDDVNRGWASSARPGSRCDSASSSKQSPARTTTPGPSQASISRTSSVLSASDASVLVCERCRSLTTMSRPPAGTSSSIRSGTNGPSATTSAGRAFFFSRLVAIGRPSGRKRRSSPHGSTTVAGAAGVAGAGVAGVAGTAGVAGCAAPLGASAGADAWSERRVADRCHVGHGGLDGGRRRVGGQHGCFVGGRVIRQRCSPPLVSTRLTPG